MMMIIFSPVRACPLPGFQRAERRKSWQYKGRLDLSIAFGAAARRGCVCQALVRASYFLGLFSFPYKISRKSLVLIRNKKASSLWAV